MPSRLLKKSAIVLLSGVAAWILLAAVLSIFLVVDYPIERADAIVVLSGSMVYKERTARAAEAYRSGVSRRVVLTDDGGYAGWSQEEQRNPPFVELAKKELINNGVDESDIEILESQVTGTIYEARLISQLARNEKLARILLVTSPSHSRRAIWTCQRESADFDVQFGVVHTDVNKLNHVTWWLSPYGWRNTAGEYMKFLIYWLFY